MAKKLMVLSACLALLLLGLAGLLGAQEVNKGRVSVTLPLKDAKAVTLDHHRHHEKAAPCENCHRLFPPEEGAVARLKGAGKLDRGKVMGNCRACHKERQARPDDCVVCHRG